MSLSAKELVDLIAEAAAYGLPTHTPEDVVKMVQDGEAQLWLQGDSFMITQLVDYPKAKSCRVWLAGGRLEEVLAMEEDLANWSKSEGCDYIEFTGRRAWGKMLKARDYAPVATVFGRALEPTVH